MVNQPDIFPKPFIPAPPPAAPSEKSGWAFSGAQRAHQALAQAHQAPDDPGSLQAVEQVCRTMARVGAEGAVALEEMLLFLAWAKLRQQSWREAAAWLAELDQRAANLTALARAARLSLRWELMTHLLAADDLEAYAVQCPVLLADSLVTNQTYLATALDALDALYSRLSSDACAEAIASAHAGLRQHDLVQASLALCQCPPAFRSAEEARACAAKTDPSRFTFSKRMKSDALLLQARAAEWTNDLRSMYVYAAAALAEAPDQASARFWLARTKLHLPNGYAVAGLDTVALPETAEWRRLQLQIKLHREPTFGHVAALLPELEQAREQLDGAEKKLTINLLKQALTIGPNWTAQDIAQCAQLCQSVEQVVGRQPWFQVNIAVQELRGGANYETARQRLEAKDVVNEPRARLLARVARVLTGAPSLDGKAQGPACLVAMETAMSWLLRQTPPLEPDLAQALRQKLDMAAQDPLCEEFPALIVVADTLRYAVGVILTEGAPASALDEWTLQDAPPWVVWLFTRVRIIQAAATGAPPLPDSLAIDNFAAAWQVEGWWSLYSPPASAATRAVRQSRDYLANAIAALPAASRGFFDQLRQTRAEAYRGHTTVEGRTPQEVEPWGIGEWGAAVCLEELEFEAEFARMRRQLHDLNLLNARGKEALAAILDAIENINKLASMLAPLSQRWWEPALNYWNAVARARTDAQSARAIWGGLTTGPKASEARAQLALLAFKERELAVAEELIAGEPPFFPSVLYVQALAQMRRGHEPQARQLLVELEEKFGESGSPYVPASRRLLAALAERAGEIEEAERGYQDILSAQPADAVTAARLGRIRLRREYQQVLNGAAINGGGLGNLLQAAADNPSTAVEWGRDYLLLHRLLTAPEQELAGLGKEVRHRTDAALAWRQVLTRRLLQAQKPADAWKLLKQQQAEASFPWRQRTRLILLAWRLLTTLPSSRRKGSRGFVLAACGQEMDEFIRQRDDGLLRRWRFLLERALVYGSDDGTSLQPESWRQLEPWPMASLPGLWAEDAGARERAGAAIAAAMRPESVAAQGPTGWNERQQQFLLALTAYHQGAEDAFLNHYERLEPELDHLPVDTADFWQAAAGIWFRRKNWRRLLEGDMPDEVADLERPQARLLIGLAYANSAVDESLNGDARKAQQRVRQARTTLEPLLEA